MAEITANSCRICLRPENVSGFKEIDKICYTGGITALDALNEMFVLKISKDELMKKEDPHKMCPQCYTNLENVVEFWATAWDSQWLLYEWKKAKKNSTSNVLEPSSKHAKVDSGVEVSPMNGKITPSSAVNIMTYCQNVVPNASGKYPCNQCSSTFDLKTSLKRHLGFHNTSIMAESNKMPILEKEGQVELSKSLLQSPVQDEIPPELEADEEFKCIHCAKSFASSARLQKHHYKRHKDLNCKSCIQTIQYKEEPKLHEKRKHAGQLGSVSDAYSEVGFSNFIPRKKIKLEKDDSAFIEQEIKPLPDDGFHCGSNRKFQRIKKEKYSFDDLHKNPPLKLNPANFTKHTLREKGEFKSDEKHQADLKLMQKIEKYVNNLSPTVDGYSCNKCSKSCITKLHLITHIRSHHKLLLVQCPYCSKYFSTNSFLTMHKSEAHTNLLDDYQIDEKYAETLSPNQKTEYYERILDAYLVKVKRDGKEKLNCIIDSCPSSFRNSSDLTYHIRGHFNIEKFKCSLCPMRFNRPYSLKDHLRTKHGDTDVEERNLLNDHVPAAKKIKLEENTVKVEPFEAQENAGTDKISMSDKEKLRKVDEYIRNLKKNDENAYKCLECHKEFTEKSKLRPHIQKHYNIRPFKCELCDASYTKSSHLKRHFKKSHISSEPLTNFKEPSNKQEMNNEAFELSNEPIKNELKAAKSEHFTGEDEIKQTLIEAMKEIEATEELDSDDEDIWNISSDFEDDECNFSVLVNSGTKGPANKKGSLKSTRAVSQSSNKPSEVFRCSACCKNFYSHEYFKHLEDVHELVK